MCSLQFREDDKLEGDLLKLLVLVIDIFASFVLTGISYSKHVKGSGSDLTYEAAASVCVFSIIGAMYASVIGGYYCRKLQQKTSFVASNYCKLQEQTRNYSELLSKHGHGLLIGLGGLCYYIGDNLPPLIKEYEGKLHCDQECVNVLQIFSIITLGFATVFYLPVLTDVFSVRKRIVPEEMTLAHVVVLLLLAKLTNMDVVYRAIDRDASYSCNEEVLIVACMGVLWSLHIFLLIFQCVWNVEIRISKTNENTNTQENTTRRCTCFLAVVIGLSITAFAASYSMADNRLPLACFNITEAVQLAVRLGLWGATIVFGLVVFVCWRCYIGMKGTVC